MKKNWKKELARDVIALGGIPFYFVVIIRSVIGQYTPFISHLLIALPVLFILSKMFKKTDCHVARGLILVVFTSIFYKVILYAVFAALLWIFIIISSLYLVKSRPRYKEAVKGVVFGVISIGVAYYLTSLLLG